MIESLRQDVGYALRVLRKSPGFTTMAALTIALGVAATTTILSVANGLLFRHIPGVEHPGRLVTGHRTDEDGGGFHAFSYPDFVDLRDGAPGLVDLAAYSFFIGSVSGGEAAEATNPVPLAGMLVSGNYFSMLGVRPALGRFFTPDEAERIGGPPVIVLSHRAWETRFRGDSAIIGASIRVNRHAFTVVGVAQEGFNGHLSLTNIAAFAPIVAQEPLKGFSNLTNRGDVWLETVGRLRPGVQKAQAGAALASIDATLEQTWGDDHDSGSVRLDKYLPFVPQGAGPVKLFMLLLLVIAGIILLIGSVNVAGMLLARGVQRSKEIGVRLALGARRGRVVRQLVTETLLLFGLGGVVGIVLTYWAVSVIGRLSLPIPIPLLLDFSPDLRVLTAALVVALGTGLVFGLLPAIRVTRHALTDVIKEGAGSYRRSRLRNAFVVAQVTGTTLLLIGAGLFLRALGQAQTINPGFDPKGIHVLGTDLDIHQYSTPEAVAFFSRLTERLEARPGVAGVAMIDILPLSLANQTSGFVVPGRPAVEGDGLIPTDYATVTPEYFSVMRIPLVRGRGFGPEDRAESPRVAIINETIARRVWPNEDPVGQRVLLGSLEDGTPTEIVGVAKDGKYRSLGEDPRAMVYIPFAQDPGVSMETLVRVRPGMADPDRLLREEVHSLDADLPLIWNAPMEDIMAISLLPSRAAAVIAAAFGTVGLLLAAIGLYGVLAQMVVQRTREIGVRIALGADRSAVRRLVLRHGLGLAAVGLVAGIAAAMVLGRLLGSLLYGLNPADPPTYLAIATVFTAVAAAACWFPARRATRTDPMQALRHD